MQGSIKNMFNTQHRSIEVILNHLQNGLKPICFGAQNG